MTRPWHNKQANNADIHARLLLNEGAVQEKDGADSNVQRKGDLSEIKS